MSKYYKAEDVINLLATEYYTHALANSLVKVEDYKVVAERNTKHLPTIEASEDCISRAEVLSIISDCQDINDKAKYNTLAEVFNKVLNAPSVVPNGHSGESTEKVGEWIVKANGNNECSVCGREKQNGWVNFCGFCGAKMKGEGDEKSMQGM